MPHARRSASQPKLTLLARDSWIASPCWTLTVMPLSRTVRPGSASIHVIPSVSARSVLRSSTLAGHSATSSSML